MNTDTGTHFRRPCLSVHRSGRVCLGSSGSRSRPSDIDSGKPAFISGTPRPASSSFRGASPQALTFLEGARFIAWRLKHLFLGECRRGPRHFVIARHVWATALHLELPKTMPCAGRLDVWQISIRRTLFIEYYMTVLCLIIYHQENYFYFLFDRVHVITNWFQVLLCYACSSFVCTLLNGFKYSKWWNSFILWLIEGILTKNITESEWNWE